MMQCQFCCCTMPKCWSATFGAPVAALRPCGCCGGVQAAERKAADAEASVAGLAGSLQQRLAGLAAEVGGPGRATPACMPSSLLCLRRVAKRASALAHLVWRGHEANHA